MIDTPTLYVLDRLPRRPDSFSLDDVAAALRQVRGLGVAGADEATPTAILDALMRDEIVSATLGGRYVVHDDARPL